LDLFEISYQEGQVVAFHVGEHWEPGKLLEKLDQVEKVVDSGIVSILTNAMALFVNPHSLKFPLYTHAIKPTIRAKQEAILRKIARQGIRVEISPTSNEYHSRPLRVEEGWRTRKLETLLRMGVKVVITDDDGGILDTTYREELRRLYFENTFNGNMRFRDLILLALNSRGFPKTRGKPTPAPSSHTPRVGRSWPFILFIGFWVLDLLAQTTWAQTSGSEGPANRLSVSVFIAFLAMGAAAFFSNSNRSSVAVKIPKHWKADWPPPMDEESERVTRALKRLSKRTADNLALAGGITFHAPRREQATAELKARLLRAIYFHHPDLAASILVSWGMEGYKNWLALLQQYSEGSEYIESDMVGEDTQSRNKTSSKWGATPVP